MHKAVVFYFSGTGNTWWVADQICKQLDKRDINADMVSIESVDAKKADWWIKAADLVFFGWPIYGSDVPEPMKRFIDDLHPLEKTKHVHTFCTQFKFSGDGAWLYHKNFEENNLIIDSCAHFDMPSNVSIWHFIAVPPKTPEKAQAILDKCSVHIKQYISDLLMGKARIKGKNAYCLGVLQRGLYRLLYNKMQDLIGVDEERCTKCGLCAKLCPADNIKMAAFPAFQKKCALCLRCYSYCPTSAITYRGKSHNIQKHGKPYTLPDTRFNPMLLK